MNVVLLTLIIFAIAYLRADYHWPFRPVLYFVSESKRPRITNTPRQERMLDIFQNQLNLIQKQGLPTAVALAALEKCLLISMQADSERRALVRQFSFRIFFQFVAISCMHFYLFGIVWIHANAALYVILYILVLSSLFYVFSYYMPHDPLSSEEDFKIFWLQLSTAGECRQYSPDYLREILEAEKRQGVSKKNLRFALVSRHIMAELEDYRDGLKRFSEYIVIFELVALLIFLAGLVALFELTTLTSLLNKVLV